jgi:hypothetical protein
MDLRACTLGLALPSLVLTTACPSDDAASGEGDSSSTGATSTTMDPSVGMTAMTIADTTDADTTDADTTATDPTGDSGSSDDPDSSGTDSSATDTGVANEPPEANDDVRHTLQDQPLEVAAAGVLANDVDADGDALSVVASDAASAAGGVVVVGADGSVSYTPVAGFFGDDSFGYTVSDGVDEASATVTIHVAPTLVQLGSVTAGTGGFVIDGEAEDDGAGSPCGMASDFDGDGLDDVVLAAFTAAAPAAEAGRAYVVFGKNGDTDPVLLADVAAGDGGLRFDGVIGDSLTGRSVAGIGDFNGDGLGDVAVGAPFDIVQNSDNGFAYVLFGRDDGAAEITLGDVLDGVGGIAFEGEFVDDLAGNAVGAAGDVNGDGLADLLVGAPGFNPNNPTPADAGRTYVIFGREAATPTVDLSEIAAGVDGFTITGEAQGDASGISTRVAGDVNGDGLDDFVIGAFGSDVGGLNSGRAYVVFGKDDDTDPVSLVDVAMGTGGFAIDGETTSDAAGFSVSRAGDFDGDGLADVVIGASGVNFAGNDAGRAYIVFGKADGAPVDLGDIVAGDGGFALTGEAAGDNCGGSVASAGDVNDDGLGDVVVGAPFADFAGTTSGRAYVVYGRSDGVAPTLAELAMGQGGFALDGEAMNDAAGFTVAGGADIDGDGVSDLLVNATGRDTALENVGRTYVVFGVPTAPVR